MKEQTAQCGNDVIPLIQMRCANNPVIMVLCPQPFSSSHNLTNTHEELLSTTNNLEIRRLRAGTRTKCISYLLTLISVAAHAATTTYTSKGLQVRSKAGVGKYFRYE